MLYKVERRKKEKKRKRTITRNMVIELIFIRKRVESRTQPRLEKQNGDEGYSDDDVWTAQPITKYFRF